MVAAFISGGVFSRTCIYYLRQHGCFNDYCRGCWVEQTHPENFKRDILKVMVNKVLLQALIYHGKHNGNQSTRIDLQNE